MIRGIGDTALWVAAHRAEESERADALFHDPFAARLAGNRGRELARQLDAGLPDAGLGTVVRTLVFDRIILRAVAGGVDVVLNLAAGLDARAFRLPLSPDLRWLDVDLPEVIAHRRACLEGETPRCRLEPIAVDLRDTDARRALLRRAGAGAARLLVVTEGLLVYLAAPEVGSLARDILAEPSLSGWLTDVGVPSRNVTLRETWEARLAGAGLAFDFAPKNPAAFFRALGFRIAESHPLLDEARRHGRLSAPPGGEGAPPDSPLWRLLMEMRPVTSALLLEADPCP